MTWLLNALGILLAGVALRDIFHTVWYPRGYGLVAHWVCRYVWRVTRVWNRRLSRSTELGGPLGLLMTLVTWTALIVLGFALIYLPHLPGGFTLGPHADTEPRGLATAVYVSVMYLSTLGLGDIAPTQAGLRLVAPVQALAGFVLLTSAISWVLQVYPTLSGRRGVALQLSLLDTDETDRLVRTGLPETASRTLDTLAHGIAECATDLSVYGESYYFRERDRTRSLPAQLPVALHLAREGAASAAAEVRGSAARLRAAIDELADTVDHDFLHTDGSTEQIVVAFSRDHQHDLTPAKA